MRKFERHPARAASRDAARHGAAPARLYATVIKTDGAEHRVRLRDIQPAGVMIDATDALIVTELIEIILPGFEPIGAKLIWEADGRMGIRLDRMIDPTRIRRDDAVACDEAYIEALKIAPGDSAEG